MDTTRSDAVLTISPFAKIAAGTRTDLEAEAERLVRFIEPEAARHAVAWA